jgi:hypothetical protein
VNFFARQPSSTWEPVGIPELPSCKFWAWFKPSQAPHSVLFQIPEGIWRTHVAALTLRRILSAAGLDAAGVHSWTLNGVTCAAQGGAHPLLDQPIPLPAPPGIAVQMNVPIAAPPISAAPPVPQPAVTAAVAPAAPLNAQARNLLEAIDAEWQAIIQIERQLEAVRRQLGGLQATLQSLNRDLDADERLFADNLDKKDWQDARRWLRDALAHVSRYIRAHDIGATSSAGNRRRFEELYGQFVEPRRPFPAMEAEQFAFEQHRKTSQNLLLQMQSTQAAAARDAVQRARMVLSRIAAKVRAARSKR